MVDGPPPDLSEYDTSTPERYEWLLSDHPWAVAERRRRTATYRAERIATVDAVRRWADKARAADPDAMSGAVGARLRGIARRLGPLAERSSVRIEVDDAEPDQVAVLRWREQWETSRRGAPDGGADYHYPEHLVGPRAAEHPPPGWPRHAR